MPGLAFDGKALLSEASLQRIRELKKIYDLDLDSAASHQLKEAKSAHQKTAVSPGRKK